MGYKAYSDNYLMSLTKTQIIELLRVAEHNYFAAKEALNNSAKAGMELSEKYDKAKELLSMAVKSFDKLTETMIPFHSIVCDYAMQFANPYDACNSCPLSNARHKTCRWKLADEAMKLIGE